MAKSKTVGEVLTKIEAVIKEARDENEKFEGEKQNNAAGGRIRKALQEIKGLVKEGRNLVTEIKNDRKESGSKKAKKKSKK
jgi:hypothetical protein